MTRSVLAGLVPFVLISGFLCGQTPEPWNMTLTGQTGQMTVWMANPGGGDCGVPVELGDFDNDGFIDYAIAPILATSGPAQTRVDAGEIIVIKGNGTIAGTINMQSPPVGQPLMHIYGGAAGDILGTEMYSADINNDGISDLILGASGADPNNVDRAGAVYVIYGGPNFTGVLDLATPPAWITTIYGQDIADRLGFWVEAGDVNGDGIEDLLMSADDGNGINNSFLDRGEAHVIYGGQTLPAVINMSSPPPGLLMTTVYGEEDADQLGSTMHSVDLDNDGFEEWIVSAALNRAIGVRTGAGSAGGDGPGNTRNGAGTTYIIWGAASLPAVIDLSVDLVPMLAANTLTVIHGADAFDFLGEEQTSGNLDGDTYNDLILGAITGDGINNSLPNAGDSLVLWGGPQLRGQIIDADLTPVGTTTLHGESSSDIGSDTLSVADVNGDGFDDLYFAMPNGDPQKPGGGVNNAGELLMLFGGPVRWPTVLEVGVMDADTDYPVRRIWGNDPNDLMGYSMEGGDVDGDGFADIFPNSMRGDGFNNLFPQAGEVGIVSGFQFSKGLTTLITPPNVGSTVSFSLVGEPGHTYIAAFALSASPAQSLGAAGTLHLANDFVFQLSLANFFPYFASMNGIVGLDGKAQYDFVVPPIGSLSGLRVFTSYVTVNTVSSTIDIVGSTTSVVLN